MDAEHQITEEQRSPIIPGCPFGCHPQSDALALQTSSDVFGFGSCFNSTNLAPFSVASHDAGLTHTRHANLLLYLFIIRDMSSAKRAKRDDSADVAAGTPVASNPMPATAPVASTKPKPAPSPAAVAAKAAKRKLKKIKVKTLKAKHPAKTAPAALTAEQRDEFLKGLRMSPDVGRDAPTLSDRLNPVHSAYEADLKEKWNTFTKAERLAIVEADKLLMARRSSGPKIKHPFRAEEEDHCETSLEAYTDLVPILTAIAKSLGKTTDTLRLYDPYYCNGSVITHFEKLGFPLIYNKNEDCYAAQKAGCVPPFDVLVTNPAYSGDHIVRLLRFANECGKPYCLLMPNYVATKDYFTLALGPHAEELCYMYPTRRYVYWTPKGLRTKEQNHSSALGTRTSPFVSFWYLHLGELDKAAFVVPDNCHLVDSLTLLPTGVRAAEPVAAAPVAGVKRGRPT